MSTSAKSWIRIALITNVVLMLVKFTAYYVTRSNIVLSDALESIINVVSSAFAVYSIYLSSLPRDWNHPYGHGKIEFFAAGFEGGLIFLAGLIIIAKSGFNFFEPALVSKLDTGLILMGSTAVVNFLLGTKLLSEGKKKNSIVMEAEGKHLLTDNYSTLAGITGVLILFLFHTYWLDSLIGIILGIYICWNGFHLLKPSISGLMDEADPKLVGRITKMLEQHRADDWIDIHNLRIVKYGNDIHIDCHVTIPFYYSLQRAHDIVNGIEVLLKKEHPTEVEIFIHADPCVPQINCKICQMQNCQSRVANHEQRLSWNIRLLTANQKHSLD